ARSQRSAQRTTFCTQLDAAVTRFTFTPRRTPLIPTGSRMPSWLSTVNSRGRMCRICRSASTGMARAPSSARSTSPRVTSPPPIAATPSEPRQRMWLPATLAYTVRISTPAMVWALSIASVMARVVQSMFDTTPLRRPRHGTLPTPRMAMPSEDTSPTTAHTLVVPMSRPTTISEESIGVFTLLGRRLPDRSGPVQLCVGSIGGSSHPHDDPVGVRVVVEEHHGGVRLPPGDLEEHALGLLHLRRVGREAEVEADALAADQRGRRAVLGHV